MSALAASAPAAVAREQRTKPGRVVNATPAPPRRRAHTPHDKLAANMSAIAKAALKDIAPGTQLGSMASDILAVVAEHVITDIGAQINRLGSVPGAKKTISREALQIVLNRDSRDSIMPKAMREEVVERALQTMPEVAAHLELKRALRTSRRVIAE